MIESCRRADRNFWRDVLDGDSYLKTKGGINRERLVVVGSHRLVRAKAQDAIKNLLPFLVVSCLCRQ